MSIKQILVPLEGGAPKQTVLDTALAAAQRFTAHLEFLYVRPEPRDTLPHATSGMSESLKRTVMETGERSAKEQASSARVIFENFCAEHDVSIVDEPPPPPPPDAVSAAWREEVGRTSAVVAQRGRLADLVVISRPTEESPTPEPLETALLETGKPVLIVPPRSHKCVASNIAIGWNASAEAARAVATAMRCLVAADTVTVLVSRKRGRSAQDLVEHLAWHGIAASVREFSVGSRSVGETLLDEARALNADLLVIGGYSHTRMRELLFGGVTRVMLASAEIPVWMAH